jgi:O-antigen ligase/tetratricopeptide (TPR) repeat protein
VVLAMAVALAIAPFVFLNGNFDPANLPQSAWVQACGFAFAAWRLGRAERLGASPLDRPLAALIAWGAASVAWALSRDEAIPVAVQWAGCGAWFVAVSRTVAGPAGARALALALFGSGAAVAALGLAQHLLGLDVVSQAVPPAATFAHKNIAAQYVTVTLPLGLAAWAEWPRRPRVTPAAAACVVAASLMAVFLAAARTRSAWAAAVTEVLVVGWLVLRDRRPHVMRRLLAAAVVAVALAAAALPAVRARARALWLPAPVRYGETTPGFTSVHHRQAIWLNTAAMTADAPLRGVGLGNHKVHYPAYARSAAVDEILSADRQLDHVHNDLLQLAAEAGLVGVALAGWLAVRALLAWRVVAQAQGTTPLLVAWAAMAAGLGVDSLFSFPMQRALPPVVLAVGLGSMAALAGLRPGPGRAAARVAAAAAAAALAAVLLFQARAVRADRHVRRMLAAEARGAWPVVRDEASAALAQRPRHRQALFALATAELARGRLPEARAGFRRLLDDHPHDLPALGNLALAHAAAGDDAAALELWARVLVLDPDDHRAHFGRGEILERMGAVWPALRSFRLAVEFNRGDPRYQLRRGQAAARAGSYPEAVTAFRAALGIAPRFAAAHEGLGNVLIVAYGRTGEGQEHLRQAEALRAGR